MASKSPEVLLAGHVIEGRWEVVRCMTSGGMGSVYEVVHRGTRRPAALKLMKPDLIESKELRERFRLETMLTAAIDSDYIVSVFDGGTEAATKAPFLVMELLRGHDLHTELAARRRIPAAEVLVYLRQVALGLTKAHDANIIHRDLKPENLFLTRRDDGSPCVKILDFGIAKVVAESLSAMKTTRAIGTPVYMAPEQIRGDATIAPTADLYALAHVGYTLLVGAPYWWQEFEKTGSVYPLLLKIVAGLKELPTARAAERGVTLPPGFDAWFAKATAPDPLDRHDGATEMVDELASVVETQAPSPHDPRGGRGMAVARRPIDDDDGIPPTIKDAKRTDDGPYTGS